MNVTRKNVRAKAKGRLNKCNILLIEGKKALAKMTTILLKEALDCDVTLAHTYQQAKEMLDSSGDDFFMAISNLNLPDAKHGEIIDLLIEHQQSVVAITDLFNHEVHEELRQKGIIDYVLKENIHAYEYLVKLVKRLYANQFVKVMVVDDSPADKKMTGNYLKRQFLKVIYAKNGEEALIRLYAQPDIKLILVDAELPIVDGLTFTARVREFRDQNSLSIVGMSGAGITDISSQFLKHGASDYISKPFSYDELTCRVNQNLNMLSYIDEVYKVAHMDFLTALPNRRYFFDRGEILVENAIKNKKHLVVAMLDIDFFKTINDTYGHDYGDDVLKELAAVIKTTLAGHLVARLGGEEFGFIVDTNSPSASRALLDQLMQNINALRIPFESETVKVAASIGATDEIQGDLDETLKIADNHLYLAKNNGRNKIVWDHAKAIVSS